jgi:hypothetical protein
MDDFYEGWDGLRPDVEQRIVDQALEPISAGRAGRWQRYDWDSGAFAEWHDLPAPDVLILEGCGSGARAYDAYRTVLVWVEAFADVRMQRGLDRDGPDLVGRWREWMETEERHFIANDTRRHADVTLRT